MELKDLKGPILYQKPTSLAAPHVQGSALVRTFRNSPSVSMILQVPLSDEPEQYGLKKIAKILQGRAPEERKVGG